MPRAIGVLLFLSACLVSFDPESNQDSALGGAGGASGGGQGGSGNVPNGGGCSVESQGGASCVGDALNPTCIDYGRWTACPAGTMALGSTDFCVFVAQESPGAGSPPDNPCPLEGGIAMTVISDEIANELRAFDIPGDVWTGGYWSESENEWHWSFCTTPSPLLCTLPAGAGSAGQCLMLLKDDPADAAGVCNRFEVRSCTDQAQYLCMMLPPR